MKKLFKLALAGAAWFGASGAHAQAPERVSELVASMVPRLELIYQDIHSHPELGFEEVRTAAILAREMRLLGFQVMEQVGRTGVVAMLRNGQGPTVMVRTEMDALPMEEKTGLPYASRVQTVANGRATFVAHSCGHDLHMASWLGAARALAAIKDQWKGTLMFVAQPAEELAGGAQGMLDAGLFTRFPKPDLALALHAAPTAYGTIGLAAGAVTSSSNGLEIVFKGRGGHGSAPDKTIDPIVMAARFVVEVQAVISREKDPMEFGVVTVGAIQGGNAGNIIPDSVTLRGTIRSYSPQVRARLLDGVRRTAQAVAAMSAAAAPDITLAEGGSAVINSAALVARVTPVLQQAFGEANVIAAKPATASEDFSAFVDQGVPSLFFFVGVLDPAMVAASALPGAAPLATNHSPFFAPVPAPSIRAGATAMSLAVLQMLAPQHAGRQ